MSKYLRKFIALFVIVFLTLSVFCITSYAEASDSTQPPQDLPDGEASVRIPERIQELISAIESNNTQYVIKFTGDSVCVEDVYLEPGYDELTERVYFDIVVDLPEGYCIYNDDSTEYVDGIKINDEFLATSRLPHRVYITDPTLNYTVFVKTVYEDTLFGTFAKIYDGNATILDLFDNPLMLAQTIYYLLAIISVVVTIIVSVKYKKYKSKSSTEIATETAAAVDTASAKSKDEIKTLITEVILTKMVPMIEACLQSNRDVVKAVAISNSKSKDAPLTILDLLGSNSQIGIADIVETLKAETEAAILAEDTAKANTLQMLHNIAEALEPTEDDTPETPGDRPSVF